MIYEANESSICYMWIHLTHTKPIFYHFSQLFNDFLSAIPLSLTAANKYLCVVPLSHMTEVWRKMWKRRRLQLHRQVLSVMKREQCTVCWGEKLKLKYWSYPASINLIPIQMLASILSISGSIHPALVKQVFTSALHYTGLESIIVYFAVMHDILYNNTFILNYRL